MAYYNTQACAIKCRFVLQWRIIHLVARSILLMIALISLPWFSSLSNNSQPSKANDIMAISNPLYPGSTNAREFASRRVIGRKLLGVEEEKVKAALKGLEDAMLEPPRARKDAKRETRYLPELLGDETLDRYQRRVFIDIGGGDGVEDWFKRHYPTGNRRFEIIRLETEEGEGETGEEEVMTRWLRGTVVEEDYVVMRAEAEVVEGLVKSGAIGLVDELFLECRHLWEKNGERKGRRAYWECISLFGRLRDEGVAVHQWWG